LCVPPPHAGVMPRIRVPSGFERVMDRNLASWSSLARGRGYSLALLFGDLACGAETTVCAQKAH